MDAQNASIMQDDGTTELTVAANHDLRLGDNVLCPLPRAATTMTISGGLGRTASITTFDGTSFATAAATSALVQDIEVIDSLGGIPAQTVKLYFVRTGASAWTLRFGIDDGATGGTAGNLRILQTVSLTFNPTGTLASVAPASPTLTINGLTNTAANLSMTLNLGTVNMSNGLFEGAGMSRLTVAQSNGFPQCTATNCAMTWNSTTNRYETTQQTSMHPGLSDWQTLRENYSFLTVPAGLPTAAEPANCLGILNFIEDVVGTDQVMLFIDRSGSMSAAVSPGATETRLDFAKAAGRAFADLQAGQGSMVGLVSFEESARLDRALDTLAAADASAFKAQIDGLAAGGNTGIGTALTAAGFEFQRVTMAGRTRSAFLLSDGQNNRGEDPRAAADRLQAQGVRIFTIPVGDEADRGLLTDVAGSTGGSMFDAPSGTELPPIYAELFARVRGEGLALPRTESAVGGQGPVIAAVPGPRAARLQAALPASEMFPFPVEGGQRLNVLLSARNLSVASWGPAFRLLGPAGEVITNADTSLIASDPYYRLIRVSAPSPGTWRLEVRASGAADQFSYVLAHVENPDPVVTVDAKPRIATPAKPVTLAGAISYVANLEGPVTLSASVRRPDGSTVLVPLPQEPLGRTFIAPFNSYTVPGIYEVTVRGEAQQGALPARGEAIFSGPERPAIDVKPFVRYARTAFLLRDPGSPPCTGNGCHSDDPPVADPTGSSGPSTVAVVTPSPNGEGWNNTNVTVQLTSTAGAGGAVRYIQFFTSGAQATGVQLRNGGSATIPITAEGITVVTFYATDAGGNREAAKTVTVRMDSVAPLISGVPGRGFCTIWPPDGRMVPVGKASATDYGSGVVASSFTFAATSSEADSGLFPSDQPNDIRITPTLLEVRAERDEAGSGRTYTIYSTVRDRAGNLGTCETSCRVPVQ